MIPKSLIKDFVCAAISFLWAKKNPANAPKRPKMAPDAPTPTEIGCTYKEIRPPKSPEKR